MEERKSKKIVVDFIELLKVIGKDKLMMAVFLGIAAVLGLAVAFGTPKEYKASVMLAPESTTSSDAIYPELYPDLIGSNDFIVSLFPVEVTTKDGSVTTDYYDYLLNYTKKAWYTFPARLLHDIVAKLKTDDVPFTGDSTKVNPFHLSKMQYNIAHKIGKSINCTVDKKTSVITIEVTDQDPVISAVMADSIKNRLQAFITQYRTQKARNEIMKYETYDFALNAWGADYDDAMTWLELWTNNSNGYRGNYGTPEYIAMIEDARSETDSAVRLDKLVAIEKKLIEEDCVVTGIYDRGYSYLQRPYVDMYIVHPVGQSAEFKWTSLNK